MSIRADGDHTRIVPTGACYDCGGRCILNVHVRDGVAIRVDTDSGEEPQLRACARGRAMRAQVYSTERLRFPQRRVGRRGEGRFERISWDEALDTIAEQLKRIVATYGPKAVLAFTLSGGVGSLHTGNMTLRQLLSALGGYTSAWGDASAEGAVFAARSTYGTLSNGNSRDDLVNSKLILLWGLNPATSIYSTNTMHWIMMAKAAGARVIVLDPRYTNTAAIAADQWVPVKPGMDTAVMAGMAYVMMDEGLHDQEFVQKFTVGFERFRDYITGIEDGTPKTPDWAEAKSGVKAATIVDIARQYATRKPGALIAGFAPGRSAFGEQFHRMACALAAMTGNVGVSGGGAGGFERGAVGPMVPPGFAKHFEGGPYEERLRQLDVPRRMQKQPHACNVWEFILKGTGGGYPTDIKMAYVAFANPLNQFPNVNKGIQALKELEFVAVHEQFMTATARFADILLPVSTVWERNDIARAWLTGPYYIYMNKVIEPIEDVKSDFDICKELAARLGVSNRMLELSEDEAVKQLAEAMEDVLPEVGDYEDFKCKGIHKIKRPAPVIAFSAQIASPGENPFPTLSGKIEIYSEVIAALSNPLIPPVPKHIDPWEGPEDPECVFYPLQLITPHQKNRAHSCFDNNPLLRQIEEQSLCLSAKDAMARGISDGDLVRVFNRRGECIVPALVTETIMPGVVGLGEGAWYQPDAIGRDRGGCPNVLARDTYAPGGSFPYNTQLVQVERCAGD